MAGDHSTSFVVFFLKNGANIDLKTADGRLPLDVFLENSDFRWAEREYESAIRQRQRRNRNEDFKCFLTKGANPNAIVTSRETQLNEALNSGILQGTCDRELGLLLCKSCNVRIFGRSGGYPLHYLLKCPPDDYPVACIAKDFISRGADPNQRDGAGKSPMMALLENAADVRILRTLSLP